MRLTTHLYLVPNLRMTGAVPQLPLFAFMACIGTNLPLPPVLRYEFIYIHFNIVFSATLSFFFCVMPSKNYVDLCLFSSRGRVISVVARLG